ncbi:DNA-directed RNA polymerase V subunit 7-like isoform X2 [Prunus yedoensis var. nudiflora]|uniref:DNA-directed RNA polymerase subunit n=1 Tax=Prunus yedoensis var. nudiflora TaxID=2094558 RepID=A0A314XNU5_PRUYE|nr:DNA-directed RNA polymerase V subunit 7-like isoform X2 [Prunus yedoensis var. nudiflora]
MFLPHKGDILEGVVHHVYRLGVFLRCGPVKYVFLSARKMPNYRYVVGEKPVFLHDDLARIEKDVVVRFEVLGVRWIERREDITKEFMMLASLQGDMLGPVTGPDGLDL